MGFFPYTHNRFPLTVQSTASSPQESAVFEGGEIQVFPGLHANNKWAAIIVW